MKRGPSKIFDRVNNRRCELINKKFGEGLSPREEKVFDYIQNHTMNLLDELHFPMPWRGLEETIWRFKQIRRVMYPKGENYPG
jgi:hypothetical protein